MADKKTGRSDSKPIPPRPDPTPTAGESAARFPFVNNAKSGASKKWDAKYGDKKK